MKIFTLRNNKRVSRILSTGGVHPPPDTPLPETATAADGTHPTGMHSWFVLIIIKTIIVLLLIRVISNYRFYQPNQVNSHVKLWFELKNMYSGH